MRRRWKAMVAIGAIVLSLSGCQTGGEVPPSKEAVVVGRAIQHPDIPGDPENAVRSMKNIYKALVKYRDATGHLPTRQKVLWDLIKQPEYGIELSEGDLKCPDAMTAGYAVSRPVTTDPRYLLTWNTKRPDGSKKPVTPKSGERDRWAFSEHYLRARWVKNGDDIRTEYYGFVIGLFSDGTVLVVPAKEMMGVKRNEGSWHTYFPGETGVPKSALPLNQMANLIRDQRRANAN